jgi:hypothetical protein
LPRLPQTRIEHHRPRPLREVSWNTHGGHFAAPEEPEILADEIHAFFRPLRGGRL